MLLFHDESSASIIQVIMASSCHISYDIGCLFSVLDCHALHGFPHVLAFEYTGYPADPDQLLVSFLLWLTATYT
jgi:hypothetical protein